MSEQFEIGDKVWVRDDEGLDTPREARGKYGFVTGTIGSLEEGTREYLVKVRKLPTFNYASYHIVKVGIGDGTSLIADELKAEFRAAIAVGDPELWERLRQAHEDPEFRNKSIVTIAFVAMWLGCEEIIAGKHGLRECDIFER